MCSNSNLKRLRFSPSATLLLLSDLGLVWSEHEVPNEGEGGSGLVVRDGVAGA